MSLQKKSKWIIVILILLAICGYTGYSYLYKPHDQISDITASYSGASEALLSKIQNNPDAWNAKVVELIGKISSLEEGGVILDGSIYCQLDEKLTNTSLKKDQIITIKGYVNGYDDLLNELKLNQCIIK